MNPRSVSRLVVVLIASFVGVWCLTLFIVMPWLETQKVTRLVGLRQREIRQRLGPPAREWSDGGFACAPEFPCAGGSAGGRVELYALDRNGWYLYYDGEDRLAGTENVRLPAPDGGRGPRRR